MRQDKINLTEEERLAFVTATTMASEKKTITERIRLIAKKPRFTMYALLLVVLAAIIAVIGTFTGAANKESEELPVSMEKCILNVNDALYYGTDETGPMGDSGCVAGNIRSTVDSGEVPLNNEESNFGCIGNPYTYDEGDGSIMVLMQDEEWHWFHISEYYNARPGNPCKNPEIAGWDLNNVKDVRADFNSMFPTPEEGTENYTYLLGQTERYYHLYGKGDYQTMLLEMDGKYAEINYPYASNYMELPELMEADVDQDGQTELFIILWLQKGTGLHIENLLLADFDDNDQLYVYQFLEEDYTAQLAENLSYEKTEDGIQPLVNGKPAGIFAKHLEDMEPFEAASVGNQMRFYYDKMTQEIKLSGQIMLLIDGHPGGLWGNYNDVTATVQWNGAYFYLTNFTSKNRLLDEQVEFALQDVYGVENLYYVKVNYDSTKMNQDTLIINAEVLPEWTDSVFDHAEIHLRRSESSSSTSGWDIENIIMDAVSNAEKIISESNNRLRDGYENVTLTYVDNSEVGWDYYVDNPWSSEKERDELAQAAMKELYTLTGYNVKECVYTTDGRSRFIFGKSKDAIRKCTAFYSRDFGFTLCGDSTPYMGFVNARRVHYSDVQQLDSPYNKEEYSGHAAIPTWFLEHSGVYQGQKIKGYDAINLDDTVYTHIKLLFDGGYYIVVMDEEIESVSEVMGPFYNEEENLHTQSHESFEKYASTVQNALSIEDILVENHKVLQEYAFQWISWKDISKEITDNYIEWVSEEGANGRMVYRTTDGVTYILPEYWEGAPVEQIAGILLTDEKYQLGCGLQVGMDESDLAEIQIPLKLYNMDAADVGLISADGGGIALYHGMESDNFIEYDCAYSYDEGFVLNVEEQKEKLQELGLSDEYCSETHFTLIAFVKNEKITGIFMGLIP